VRAVLAARAARPGALKPDRKFSQGMFQEFFRRFQAFSGVDRLTVSLACRFSRGAEHGANCSPGMPFSAGYAYRVSQFAFSFCDMTECMGNVT
jgi:hypothetical protein